MSVIDNIPGRVGNAMIDQTGPEDATRNYGVASKLAREFFGGGQRFGSRKSTREILSEGEKAAEEVRHTKINEDDANALAETLGETQSPKSVQPTNMEPDAPQPEIEPVGMTVPEIKNKAPDPATADEIMAVDTSLLERRTRERNINLDYIEEPDDIAKVLEANAARMDTPRVEGLAEIEADVAGNDAEILREVLVDPSKRNQNLTSRQLLAGRNMLVSMSEDTYALAEKIAKGLASDEDKVLFEKMQAQTVMLQQFMQDNIREAGRALNSMKIVAKTINSRELKDMLNMASEGASHTQTKAEILVDYRAANPDAKVANQIDQMANISRGKRVSNALVNLWMGGILSGWKTQGVNVISNAMFGVVDTVAVKPIAAAISPVRRAASHYSSKVGDGAGLDPYEALAEMVAMKQGLMDSIILASKVWTKGTFRDGGEYVSSFGEKRTEELTRGAETFTDATGLKNVPVLGALGNLYERSVRAASFGGLAAGDEFFKTIAYRKTIYATAIRQARQEGLDGNELMERASDLMNKPTAEMHYEAMNQSERLTFTNDADGLLGSFADKAISLVNEYPSLKFFAPFIKTPIALLDRGINFTVLAPFKKDVRDRIAKGGPEADVALAELTIGAIMLPLVWQLHDNNILTGAGPENRFQREPLERLGWEPNSAMIEGKGYVQYSRGLDPFSSSIGAMTLALDRIKYQDDELTAAGLTAELAFALGQFVKEQPYLTGMAQLMSLIEGNMNVPRWFARQGASFVPTFVRDVANITGENQMIPSTMGGDFWEQFKAEVMARTPVLRDDLPPKRYWDGSVILGQQGEATYLYNQLSPIRISGLRNHPESAELAKNSVNVTPPSSKITFPNGRGLNVDLLKDLENGQELYDAYLEMVGKARLNAVQQVIESDAYKDLPADDYGPNSNREEMLVKAVTRGLTVGKEQFFREFANISPEQYGEKAILLDPEYIEDLGERIGEDDLSEEEMDLLREQDVGGFTTRPGGLYVPQIK
jgi:hypothetical protein